nr:hypothetical protein [Tanacetum cinerariifolium]
MSDMIALLNDLSYIPSNNKQNEPTQGDIGETSNEPTQAKRNKFEELYVSANEELYPGYDYVTRLEFMEKFTYFKVKGKLTDSIFNEMLEFFQHVFPTIKGYKLPPLYYVIKKTFKMIGLGYKSIHACVNDCFLFRGDNNKDVHFCPVCKTSRWKDGNTPGKDIDVYLRPLIDDLKTINDFPARSSLSGWSGQGYKACPTCNEDTPSDDMLKAQSKVVDILCNLELIYLPAFFDIMIHLVIHLPLEALEGGPIRPRKFPNKDMKEEFPDWFGSQICQRHVDNDPGVSATSELFALACGPTLTPISVNSCVVNGVSLNDLDNATLHIDGQSTEVDAPLDIIDLDEDDDIIDDEDDLPHDLADSDDEDLINVDDDDDGVDMSAYPPVARVASLTETQFDLKPHMQSQRWTDITAGIQQHLQKFYNTNKASLKETHWVIHPETETYDMESIRQRRPENITPADWNAQIAFWNDPRNQARAA